MSGLLAGLLLSASLASGPPAPIPAIEPVALGAALHRAADSLQSRVSASGRFLYRLDAEGRLRPGYNAVRHAGTLWALQALQARQPDPERAAALARASQYLEHCCLRPLPAFPAAWAVWSDDEGEPAEAKLGAAGLALAAWQGLRAQGLPAPAPERLQGLARFLVYQQKPNGHFHAKFRNGRRDDRWVSLYYPGEAALGLLAQHRADGDPRWREAAGAALLALADQRQRSGRYLADHWALIASQALAEQAAAGLPDPLQAHLEATVAVILEEGARHGDDFGRGGRTAPIATRLEGLLAALPLLAPDGALAQASRAQLGRSLPLLLGAARRHPPLLGAIPRALPGSTDPRAAELRIDDTQHVLSVLLGLCRLQKYACTRP
ncbi:MAG TPA: hypothetical protein VFV27_10730 [Nevskiaceae bacterium]|nr:hypothetical protein [Nevskiaceae bacterium]